jgi:transcriptional regulator with XRE-family HTH domain
MTRPADADAVGTPSPPVGTMLAGLRRAAGVTGIELGRRVNMSQAKISRIENGVGFTNPRDVERLARALDAPPDLVARLVELAQHPGGRMADWHAARGAMASMQQEIAELEATTRTFRVFQPAVVVGLLQSSEYARAVFGAEQAVLGTVGSAVRGAAIPEAVSARVRRQEVLADTGKRFHFIMLEAVLSNRFGRPADMPGQIARIREVARQDNVTVAVVPADRTLPIPPFHGFELLDDRCVVVDVFNTTLILRGHQETDLYGYVFDEWEQAATTEIDPILDRYLDFYLDLSRPRPRAG